MWGGGGGEGGCLCVCVCFRSLRTRVGNISNYFLKCILNRFILFSFVLFRLFVASAVLNGVRFPNTNYDFILLMLNSNTKIDRKQGRKCFI